MRKPKRKKKPTRENRVKKYEYLIQRFPPEDEPWKINEVCDAMSALGDKGWELVSVLPIDSGIIKTTILCYFKREKPN
jgi:hypothetical protein